MRAVRRRRPKQLRRRPRSSRRDHPPKYWFYYTRKLPLPIITIVARGFRIGQILVVDPTHDLDVAARRRREGGHVLHEAQRAGVAQHDRQAVMLGLHTQQITALLAALATLARVDRRVGVALVLGLDVRLEAADFAGRPRLTSLLPRKQNVASTTGTGSPDTATV